MSDLSHRIPSTCNAVENEILVCWKGSPNTDQLPDTYMKIVLGPVGTTLEELRYQYANMTEYVNDVVRIQWNSTLAACSQFAKPDELHYAWATHINATALPYDGPTRLTESEQQTLIAACSIADLNLDIVWATIEGLGWRPGQYAHSEGPAKDLDNLRKWWNPVTREPSIATWGAAVIGHYDTALTPSQNHHQLMRHARRVSQTWA